MAEISAPGENGCLWGGEGLLHYTCPFPKPSPSQALPPYLQEFPNPEQVTLWLLVVRFSLGMDIYLLDLSVCLPM